MSSWAKNSRRVSFAGAGGGATTTGALAFPFVFFVADFDFFAGDPLLTFFFDLALLGASSESSSSSTSGSERSDGASIVASSSLMITAGTSAAMGSLDGTLVEGQVTQNAWKSRREAVSRSVPRACVRAGMRAYLMSVAGNGRVKRSEHGVLANVLAASPASINFRSASDLAIALFVPSAALKTFPVQRSVSEYLSRCRLLRVRRGRRETVKWGIADEERRRTAQCFRELHPLGPRQSLYHHVASEEQEGVELTSCEGMSSCKKRRGSQMSPRQLIRPLRESIAHAMLVCTIMYPRAASAAGSVD